MFEGVRKSVVIVGLGRKAEVAVHDRRLGLSEDHGQPRQLRLVLGYRQNAAEIYLRRL